MSTDNGQYDIVRVAAPRDHFTRFDTTKAIYDVVWREPHRADYVLAYGVYYPNAVAIVEALTTALHDVEVVTTDKDTSDGQRWLDLP